MTLHANTPPLLLASVGIAVLSCGMWWSHRSAAQARAAVSMVDDFEQESVGGLPSRWRALEGRTLVPLEPERREQGEYYAIHREAGSRFLRLRVSDESVRLVLPNGSGMNWDLEAYPRLSWRWRANRIPEGASEEGLNDTAGAVYVTFSTDWLGRPRSIKYTYSSTLPVGTVLSQGRLKVVVVASGLAELGRWERVDRNVADDYRRLFRRSPPSRPLSIAVWSDADTTHQEAEIDFDDITLLSEDQ